MAKSNIATVPMGTYAAGTYNLGPVNAGKTATSFEVAIDRTAFPNTTDVVATLTIEGSDDNGSTWVGLGGISLTGGEIHDREGNVATESIYSATFDNSQPATYRLRATAVLFQELTTGLRLTVS